MAGVDFVVEMAAVLTVVATALIGGAWIIWG